MEAKLPFLWGLQSLSSRATNEKRQYRLPLHPSLYAGTPNQTQTEQDRDEREPSANETVTFLYPNKLLENENETN